MSDNDNTRLFMTTMQEIRRLGRHIGEKFQPDKIILFGSYARGSEHADSDVDLLVIMPSQERGLRGLHQAAKIRADLKTHFPVDVIVRSPEEVRARLEIGDFFMREILEQGKVLYEAGNG